MRVTACLLLLLSTVGCLPIIVGARITADASEKLADLLEESKTGDPNHAGITGLVIDQEGKVVRTIHGSPAYNFSVKPGSRIISVDGRPFDATMLPLSGLPDTTITLVLDHKGKERTIFLRRVFWRSLI